MSETEKEVIYQVEIPVVLDVDAVVRRLRLGNASGRMEEMAYEVAEKARLIARPRGVYKEARSQNLTDITTEIDGKLFTSKVLNKLLKGRGTVYPFIATIGKELDEYPLPPRDMMRQFCLDNIKTAILVNAVDYLTLHIREKHLLGPVALLNPGEIEDWEITQQRPLFELFPDVENLIGVTLTSGGVMKPIKSRSGLIFSNDTGWVSCQLCTQPKCPGRRAKFDPELKKQYLA